jgi:amino acid transporter/nucleotide-binding universal stress UspA family protein
VPGILYGQVGERAPLFVALTMIGFIFLAAKYTEVCWRVPEGGGVVNVATKAFTPLVGTLGGVLILIDYFLTSAISTTSGLHYLASVFPRFATYIPETAILVLVIMAEINIIGIRESAMVALVAACAALAVDLGVIGFVLFTQPGAVPPVTEWLSRVKALGPLTPMAGLSGMAGAWLAFSGLESISQITPAMTDPLKRTARRGMLFVIITVMVTAPVLALFAVAILPTEVKLHESEQFISDLGSAVGGTPLKWAVVISASVLLLLASNTAIIGSYHVFLALATAGFLPRVVLRRNNRFKTPHIAIVTATVFPIGFILLSGGHLDLLGAMYAFGLLGAFFITSLSVDVLRWRDRQLGAPFVIGLAVTLLVLVSWCVNIVTKHEATLVGGTLTVAGMGLALLHSRGWFTVALYRLPWLERRSRASIEEAEQLQIDSAALVSVAAAHELLELFPSRTVVALRAPNRALLTAAVQRERERKGASVYALYVEERPGLFTGESSERPDPEGVATLKFAVEAGKDMGMQVLPVWTISYDAVEGISRAAEALQADTVFVAPTRRTWLYHLVRGNLVERLRKQLALAGRKLVEPAI